MHRETFAWLDRCDKHASSLVDPSRSWHLWVVAPFVTFSGLAKTFRTIVLLIMFSLLRLCFPSHHHQRAVATAGAYDSLRRKQRTSRLWQEARLSMLLLVLLCARLLCLRAHACAPSRQPPSAYLQVYTYYRGHVRIISSCSLRISTLRSSTYCSLSNSWRL